MIVNIGLMIVNIGLMMVKGRYHSESFELESLTVYLHRQGSSISKSLFFIILLSLNIEQQEACWKRYPCCKHRTSSLNSLINCPCSCPTLTTVKDSTTTFESIDRVCLTEDCLYSSNDLFRFYGKLLKETFTGSCS